MKYIYYIIAIMIIFSGLAAYGLFDTRVEISKPFLSINDRIISEDEFEKMSLTRTSHIMSREQFIESIIARQLLIQEAIKMNINKEESFRHSVENFYEQSLIKILLDRKLDSLVVDVTNDEIAKYETLSQNRLFLTKMIYPNLKDAQNRINGTIEKLEVDFIDLSDDLKFIVLNLNIGDSSKSIRTDFGVFIYRLDDIQKKEAPDKKKEFDIKRVSLFIQDKKKEQLLAEWTDAIRQTAEIWRKDE
jgi:parvulin-like peptidyl-prolyl isomerase